MELYQNTPNHNSSSWLAHQKLDYVATFPQAPVERELYMKLSKEVDLQNKLSCDCVLKLYRNTYGQKNSGRVWNRYLVNKLKNIGFKQSKIDECVLYKEKVVYALYIVDSILEGPNPTEMDDILK